MSDIDQESPEGNTALHIAATEGFSEVVEWLLKKGASVHKRNQQQHNALWIAVDKDHTKVGPPYHFFVSFMILTL